MATKKQVVFLIFPNFNTLDLNGPQEVLKNYAMGKDSKSQMFSIAIAAASDITTAFEQVQIKRDISFDGALQSISKFDIMIVAGGPEADVDAAIAKNKETKMLDLISAFASQKADSEHPKWLVSICTGAGFLATRGLFAGKTVTSHWGYLDYLRDICQKYSKTATTVVRERWVSAGLIEHGVQLVTSGGVSWAIDCTLWLLSEIAGMVQASNVALMMDYDWKYRVTSGQIV